MNFQYNYNLSGSDRKPLIEAISQILVQPAIYQGAPSFTYMIGECMVDRNGILSGDDNKNSETVKMLVEALRECGFVAESAGNTVDDETAMKNMLEVGSSAIIEGSFEAADIAEENTSDTEITDPGLTDVLTVEIPNTGFTPEAKENLKKIVAGKKTILEKALGANGLPIIERDDKLIFPWFTLHGLDGEADAYSRLITAICKMSKEQKRVTVKDEPVENEKYTMRLFLVRLGFIGDEYKTARKILLRNLAGNSSWKSGYKPKQDMVAVIPSNQAGESYDK